MHKIDFLIHKQSFIKSRRENIHQFYQFDFKELGRGAYGVVYKAKKKSGTGEWRAIKKITKRKIKHPQILLNQIEILKSLDHPSCIKLYQTFEDETQVYLVTDLCEGGELFDRLDVMGNFSEQDARKIFIQIVQALTHRDFKPENFLFLNKKSMDLKLIDFGMAYRWKQDMKAQLLAKGDRKLVGTSYYIAPEIIAGCYDQTCDVWSAGIILYMLLSGIPPFDGENDLQILEQVRKMNEIVPEMKLVSEQAKNLITQMLQLPSKRISILNIFADPWILKERSKVSLKLNMSRLTSFTTFSKLKKLAATYIATQLSQKQVQDLSNLFKQMDLNHDGQISLEQLKIALKDEQNQPSITELANLMESIDTDQNGRINYNQFLASCLDQEKLFTEERMQALFKMIDKDSNGFVEKEELLELLESSGTSIFNGRTVDEIISSCDKDGNGLIDYNQFKASLLA